MRPFDIAPVPKNPDGTVKTVTDYQHWRQDLIDAYGGHCAYCNVKIPNSAEVEHQIAQSMNTNNPLDWSNLVLACKPCNIAKSAKPFTALTHFIPTYHNTHLAFDYVERPHKKLIGHFAYIPVPNQSFQIGSQAYIKAERTIKDLNLDRVEQNKARTQRATDIRWKCRYEGYLTAFSSKTLWDTLTTQHQKNLFLDNMKLIVNQTGFFSLWYNVFSNEPQALQVIIEAFKRTNSKSFPSTLNFIAKPRVEGDL